MAGFRFRSRSMCHKQLTRCFPLWLFSDAGQSIILYGSATAVQTRGMIYPLETGSIGARHHSHFCLSCILWNMCERDTRGLGWWTWTTGLVCGLVCCLNSTADDDKYAPDEKFQFF